MDRKKESILSTERTLNAQFDERMESISSINGINYVFVGIIPRAVIAAYIFTHVLFVFFVTI